MKLTDIINQLRAVLPKYTDVFSTVQSIASDVASAGTATLITATKHGLVTGAGVTIADSTIHTFIGSVSQDGLVFTFGTILDHDLTLGFPGYETVLLSGFTDSAWNASLELVAVPNRKTFKVRSTNVIPTLTGAEALLEVRSDGVNTRSEITVVDPLTFTIDGDFIDGIYSGGVVASNPRISGAVNVERAIEQYTKQELEEYWLFVVMDSAEVSKSRTAESDSVGTVPTGADMRFRIIDGFSVYIIKNTEDNIAALSAMDACRHDLLLPLLKSVFGARFDTGLTGAADFKTILLGHQAFLYERAYLVYEYQFQLSMDMTNADTVIAGDTRAFRDIEYTEVINGTDTEDMEVDIDLDEEPL